MRDEIQEMLVKECEAARGYEGDNLFEDGIMDSLEWMALVIAIEDTYDLEMDPDDITEENFRTLDEMCLLVDKYIGNK